MLDHFMTDRVTIRRAAGRTVSATGTAKETWANVKSGVAASIQQRGVSYQQREQGQKNATRWKGFFRGTEDVRVNDVIVHGNRKYKVESVYTLGAHQEVELVPHEE